MPALIALLAVLVVTAYVWVLWRLVTTRRHHALAIAAARTPEDESAYLAVARDHYRRLQRWARLFEDLRGTDYVWPLLDDATRDEIERELDDFHHL